MFYKLRLDKLSKPLLALARALGDLGQAVLEKLPRQSNLNMGFLRGQVKTIGTGLLRLGPMAAAQLRSLRQYVDELRGAGADAGYAGGAAPGAQGSGPGTGWRSGTARAAASATSAASATTTDYSAFYSGDAAHMVHRAHDTGGGSGGGMGGGGMGGAGGGGAGDLWQPRPWPEKKAD